MKAETTQEDQSENSLLIKAQELGETTLNLLRLKAIQTTASTISLVGSYSLILTVVLFGFLMLSTGLAIWISQLLGNWYAGFFILAASFLLIGLFLYLFMARSLRLQMQNLMIKKLFPKQEDENLS